MGRCVLRISTGNGVVLFLEGRQIKDCDALRLRSTEGGVGGGVLSFSLSHAVYGILQRLSTLTQTRSPNMGGLLVHYRPA